MNQDPVGEHSDSGDTSNRRPAGMCRGQGHIVVYGNPAFVAAFGAAAVGMPAREGILDLPPRAFAMLDAVLIRGKPLASWIRMGGSEWRLTVVPSVDPAGEVYGVSFHLRERSDTLVTIPGPDVAGGARS